MKLRRDRQTGTLIRSSIAGLGFRLAGVAAGFGLGLLLARLLGPAQFGLYGLIITVASLVASLAMLGTPQLAVREISNLQAREDVDGTTSLVGPFQRIVGVAAFLLATAALSVGLMAGARGQDVLLLALGCVLMITTALGGITAAQLRALGRLQQGQFFDTAGRPLLALMVMATVWLASLPVHAAIAIGVQAGVSVLAMLVSWGWLRQALPRQLKWRSKAVPWLAAALPLCGVDFLGKLDGAYGLVLLGPFGSDEQLGFYRVALACVTLVGMPATVLHVVLAPKIAAQLADEDWTGLATLLRRVSFLLLCCMIPGTLLLALLGEVLLSLAFGSAYAAAAMPLLFLAIAQTVFAAFGMGPILLAMGGAERSLIRIYLVAVTAGIISAIPLILRFGANGAAAAQIVSLSLIGLQCWLYARKRWGLNLTCFGRANLS